MRRAARLGDAWYVNPHARLDTLDMSLLTADDAPALAAVLDTPVGQADDALAALERYEASIDVKARRRSLADDPLYAPYCR